MKESRYAIVTPYFKEPRQVLQRCTASVRAQTVNADHIVVSDGHPQGWLDTAGVTHLRLDYPTADCGDTPRGLGALLAIARGYEGIGFLDADNWYDAGHVEACEKAGGLDERVDVVIAKRRFVRPDESPMNIADNPAHVDTNCLWLRPGSFHLARNWLMPAQLAPIGDRVFYAMLKANDLNMTRVPQTTVNYTCRYASMFRALGEEPPSDAKESIDSGLVYAWLLGLPERERRLVALRCGVDMVPMAETDLANTIAARANAAPAKTPARNDACPCGSGQKYKHCHGAL